MSDKIFNSERNHFSTEKKASEVWVCCNVQKLNFYVLESLIYPASPLPQCISYTCALPSSIQFLPNYFCKCDNHKCNILWHLPFPSSSWPSWSRVCANVPTSMCSTSETHCYSQLDPLRMPLLWGGCTTSPVIWTRGWVVWLVTQPLVHGCCSNLFVHGSLSSLTSILPSWLQLVPVTVYGVSFSYNYWPHPLPHCSHHHTLMNGMWIQLAILWYCTSSIDKRIPSIS